MNCHVNLLIYPLLKLNITNVEYHKYFLKIEVLISKTFIDSIISHDGFALMNNVLNVHEEMNGD